MIDVGTVAFDIDGVVADTMTLFLDIARDEYRLNGLRYEDITRYNIGECLNIETETVEAIIGKLLDGNHRGELMPVAGARGVLGRLAGRQSYPILFVTARPYVGHIHEWMAEHLSLEPAMAEIIPTGSFDNKAEVLLDKGVSFFVEDRLETCFLLKDAGITPVLFRQPWNREKHPFTEVSNWEELESLIKF